jgi:multidrug efflux pump subunit AcrB
MRIECYAGWILILGAFLLLITSGRIGLVLILVPLSLLFACAIMAFLGRSEGRLTDALKKG